MQLITPFFIEKDRAAERCGEEPAMHKKREEMTREEGERETRMSLGSLLYLQC